MERVSGMRGENDDDENDDEDEDDEDDAAAGVARVAFQCLRLHAPHTRC